jgi:drug/metabolite transporter (DMT)-like permease
MKFSPRAIGLIAALVTILIWTSFIVIARASASHNLLPLDIAFLRILGAGSVLLPWAWWLMRPQRQAGEKVGSLFGLSPLPIRITIIGGFFGSFIFSMLSYAGFFFAPAAHASILMPGSLPLWTTLMAWLMLSQSISKVRAIGLTCIVLGDLLVGGSSLLKAFDGGEVWKGDLMFMCAASCWSFYTVLVRREGLDAERWNMLNPEQTPILSYVGQCLSGAEGPVISSTDYMKSFADQIRNFVPQRFVSLGTDGYGRSDSREALRSFFEVDRYYVVLAALKALADEGKLPASKAAEAIKKYKIDASRPNPTTV